MYGVQLFSISTIQDFPDLSTRRTFTVAILMGAILFRMSLLCTITLHMLSTCLSKASTVGALRYWSSFFVDVDQRTICRGNIVSFPTCDTEGSFEKA
jgi:hypothetical protein